MAVGERIKLIRKRKNLTQEQLAAKLSLKQATIVRYENSSITPSIEVLLRMSMILKEDIGWLLTGEKKNGEKESESKTLKCPEIIKQGVKNLRNNQALPELLSQHKLESASVKRKNKIVREVKELRAVAQDLMDRIIELQEEMKKGL